jgi:hypothetical protein
MERLRAGGVPERSAGGESGAIGNVSVVSIRESSPDGALTSDGPPTTSKYGGASPRGSANPGLSAGGEDGSLCRRSERSTDREGMEGLELSCS